MNVVSNVFVSFGIAKVGIFSLSPNIFTKFLNIFYLIGSKWPDLRKFFIYLYDLLE